MTTRSVLRRVRRLSVPCAALAAVLAIGSGTVSASNEVLQQQIRFEATTQTDLGCGGLPFTDHVVVHETDVVSQDRTSPEQRIVQLDATDINASGAEVDTFVRYIDRLASATSNADGSTTFIDNLSGIPERLTTPDGTVITEDVGLVVLSTTIDASGNVVDMHVVREAGAGHPEADSGFTLFCQVILTYLG